MGRWSQRQRTGGAGSTANYITRLESFSNTEMLLTYRFGVDASALVPDNFVSIDNEFIAAVANNQAANEVILGFEDDVDTELGVTYNGTTPGLINHQEINYS